MSEPFMGEIRMFSGNFAPRGWATCDGQLLPYFQYAILASIIGNTFGGDGSTTIGLPNLAGRTPVGMGAGAGLTPRNIGDVIGENTVTLGGAQMPRHSHPVAAYAGFPDTKIPSPSVGLGSFSQNSYDVPPSNPQLMAYPGTTSFDGGGGAHNNTQPYLGLTFIISLAGLFPPRPPA